MSSATTITTWGLMGGIWVRPLGVGRLHDLAEGGNRLALTVRSARS